MITVTFQIQIEVSSPELSKIALNDLHNTMKDFVDDLKMYGHGYIRSAMYYPDNTTWEPK